MTGRAAGRRWLVALVAVTALAPLLYLGPVLPGLYWSARSSNPVRRGMTRAAQLGCFGCHGPAGGSGIPDPAASTTRVPAWTGGDWTMYVLNESEARRYIKDGARPLDADAIEMPAYHDHLEGSDLDDLVAAFKVVSGMVVPPAGTDARRGLKVAGQWGCFSCHGPGGCGGAANPGSLTGFIPGWYGPAFDDLVRDRLEFDEWIETGTLARLQHSRIASWFLRRQRTPMPAYAGIPDTDLDALWAYRDWLAATDGGHRPAAARGAAQRAPGP